MTFRIAVVQPIAHRPGEDEKNVADAVRTIERAADAGRAFRLLPGDLSGPVADAGDVRSDRRDGRGRREAQACMSCSAPSSRSMRKAATAYNLICMAYPDGRAPARYRRTHPNGPWIYTGGTAWEFQYVPGDEFPVFDTVHGKVGLAMCSEVYMPEVARALALRGAELIFMPAGKDKRTLWATWRTLIWARAIENLALVVTTQNLFDHAERGLAMVAAPEEILFESTAAGHDRGRRRASTALRFLRAHARRGRLVRAIAPPSRACSARNGSGRSFTTRSIRGRCAKRRSDAHVPSPRSRPAGRVSAIPQAASSAPPSGAPTRLRCARWRATPRRRLCDRRRAGRAEEDRERPRSAVHARRGARARRARRRRVFLGLLDGAAASASALDPAAAEALKARDDLARHRPALDRRAGPGRCRPSAADRRSQGAAALARAASLLRQLRRADQRGRGRLAARLPGLQGRSIFRAPIRS